MRNPTGLAIALSLILAILLLYFSFASFVLTADYMDDGEVEVGLIDEPCSVFFMLLVWVLIAPVMFVAYRLVRWIETRRALQAAYFLLLYPVVLISYIIATFSEVFLPSMVFGFPLFIVGAIFYPYCAVLLDREYRAMRSENVVRLACHHCSYIFELHRKEEERRCPMCGAVNLNPYAVTRAEEEELEEERSLEAGIDEDASAEVELVEEP